MGSPFLLLGFGVHEVALILTQNLNHYTRCFSWVIPTRISETRNLRKRAAELMFKRDDTESDESILFMFLKQ